MKSINALKIEITLDNPKGDDAFRYSEVKTPQTPECEHVWKSDWGWGGPIMVCEKCRTWHHD